MRRLLFLAFLLPIAGGAYRYHGDSTDPPKLRRWVIEVPGWHPTTAAQWERMSLADRMQRRHDDHTVLSRFVIPDDARRLQASLVITLSKGQHRGGDYWPAVLDGLEANGITAEPGSVKYRRGEVGTTIELEEVQP